MVGIDGIWTIIDSSKERSEGSLLEFSFVNENVQIFAVIVLHLSSC